MVGETPVRMDDECPDLVPLCANCHVMTDGKRTTMASIDELKSLVEEEAS